MQRSLHSSPSTSNGSVDGLTVAKSFVTDTDTETDTDTDTIEADDHKNYSLFGIECKATALTVNENISSSKGSTTPSQELKDKISRNDNCASNQQPVESAIPCAMSNTENLVRRWIIRGMVLPAVVVAAFLPVHLTTLVSVALFAPLLAIIQGSLGILQFRVRFGAAPVPIAPSHGVVFAKKSGTTTSSVDSNHDQNDDVVDRRQIQTDAVPFGQAQIMPPVRLLVIGDSLAIGVGQRYSAFPILPRVLAQTLSRELGRVVYWTCHGAPGASTGWVVRELERGVTESASSPSSDLLLHHEFITIIDQNNNPVDPDADALGVGLVSSCQISSSSSSSTTEGDSTTTTTTTTTTWRDQLTAHRKLFNPELLGPYDVVVVLTGSNDLKSAFFPFLLTGEDAEFRRQAQLRGGSYNTELQRLIETLYDKMKVRIQQLKTSVRTQVDNVRSSVEIATETVTKKVEETILMIPGSKSFEHLFPRISSLSTLNNKTNPEEDHYEDANNFNDNSCHSSSSSVLSNSEATDRVRCCDINFESNHNEVDAVIAELTDIRSFPLVVLPGMPSRSLPIFGTVPLRWLACPIVDIMDQHKHDLAACHPGQVLFVPAPHNNLLNEYERGEGIYRKEQADEYLDLNLQDPVRCPSLIALLEGKMQDYYRNHRSWTWWKQSGLFCEDQIHPNDDGYAFWGRYIAHAVLKELEIRPARSPQ